MSGAEDDDYLSDKFIVADTAAASASTTSLDQSATYTERRRQALRASELKSVQNRKKSKRQLEEESLKEGMGKSLFERAAENASSQNGNGNKAMNMMFKVVLISYLCALVVVLMFWVVSRWVSNLVNHLVSQTRARKMKLLFPLLLRILPKRNRLEADRDTLLSPYVSKYGQVSCPWTPDEVSNLEFFNSFKVERELENGNATFHQP